MLKLIQNVLNRRLDIFMKCERCVSNTLQNSKGMRENVKGIPTLPKLPIAPLQPSLEKYLRSVRPLLSEEEYSNTCRKVTEFGSPGGKGEKLHKLLLERANATDNWMQEWWIQVYLEERKSLLVTSIFTVFDRHEHLRPKEDRIGRVSRMVAGALAFKRLVDNNTLEAEKYEGQDLDMSQYNNIFTSCRIPGSPVDSLILEDSHKMKPKHIIVVHNNNYFRVDVYNEDGTTLSKDQLLSQFQKVMSLSEKTEHPIGVLTSLDRDRWLKAYKTLKEYDPENEKSLTTIEKSIFILCLDKIADKKCTDNLKICHGEGVEENSGNRWLDKCLQVIAKRDGGVAITFEHTPAEAVCLLRLFAYMIDYNESAEVSNTHLPEPTKLNFRLPHETFLHLEEAKENLNNIIEDLDSETNFTFDMYGKDFIKSHKMNPDSFIQMAIQLAFYKLHGQVTAAYETASTRKFLYGRTETIRSTSIESEEFCKKMTDVSQTPVSKLNALKKAVLGHKEYQVQAMNGMGIDRLLLGMKKLVLDHKMDMPDIFTDLGFTRSIYFKLSTSQVSYRKDIFGLLPNWVHDGYAVFYTPTPSFIIVTACASNSCPETGTKTFLEALTQALAEMHDVVIAAEKSCN